MFHNRPCSRTSLLDKGISTTKHRERWSRGANRSLSLMARSRQSKFKNRQSKLCSQERKDPSSKMQMNSKLHRCLIGLRLASWCLQEKVRGKFNLILRMAQTTLDKPISQACLFSNNTHRKFLSWTIKEASSSWDRDQIIGIKTGQLSGLKEISRETWIS